MDDYGNELWSAASITEERVRKFVYFATGFWIGAGHVHVVELH